MAPAELSVPDSPEPTIDAIRRRPEEKDATVQYPARDGDALGEQPRVGRYVVLETAGVGGMGRVLRAYDPKLRREVALKVLRTRRNEEADARLVREAQAMAQLNHPNVLAVYDVESSDEAWFIAMEFVEGQTLGKWLREGRSWKETLAAFVAAAEGLGAAHQVGLVHRDFKPANVLVGRDGRVRVMDFGLARATTDDPSTAHASTPSSTPSPDTSAPDIDLTSSLTREGTVMGTPAYMAPEQHVGEPADARSDQYSFCIALWEGLYGQRPFRGRTMEDLVDQKNAFELPDPGPQVPRWLHRAVVRGLSPRPAQRHDSMAALLAAVTSNRGLRRRWLAVGSVIAVGATAAGIAYAQAQQALMCRGGTYRVDEIWNDERRAKAHAGLLATGAVYAEDTWSRVEERLDGYTRSWLASHREACEATHVRQEQSAQLMDQRMACLSRRLAEIEIFVAALENADQKVVERAAAAAQDLSGLAACADVELLMAAVAPPAPEVAAEVEAARTQMAESFILQRVARFDAAESLATKVADAANRSGYAPLIAESLRHRGNLHLARDRYPEAAESFAAATRVALAAGHDGEAARAVVAWMSTMGMLARYDEAVELARWAQAIVARAPDPAKAGTSLSMRYGGLMLEQGHFDEAEAHLRGAMAAIERSDPLDKNELATVMHNLGVLLYRRGEFPEARELLERALDISVEVSGVSHPSTALTISNLGNVCYGEQRMDCAERHFRRALTIKEQALGPDDSSLFDALVNLGGVETERGEYAPAKQHFQRALEVRERALGPDHPDLAYALAGLGAVALRQNRREDARAPLERAAALAFAAGTPGRPEFETAVSSLCDLYVLAQQFEDTAELASRGIASIERALGGRHASLVRPMMFLGLAKLGTGDPQGAVPALERALLLALETGQSVPVPRIRFALARALGRTGDRERAVELAHLARSGFADAGHTGLVAGVEKWLAARE